MSSMSEHKHRPVLSAPPSFSAPFVPATRRKRIWDRLASSGQLRIVSILLLGLSVFLGLHAAFGQLSRPRFQHLDTFPKKIWQSWKVDPLRFEDRDIKRARSWTGLNPSHRYEVLTDTNALPWVELHFGPSGFNRPDIITTYKALENNLKIIQADLLRYLIMYVEGGVWTDIDVQALKPVDSFIPKGFQEQDIDMIIGIETDEPDFKDHPVLGSKAQSFCQWTFACKPRLPVMLQLIDNIQIWLARLAREQKKEISELHLGFDEVLSGTGPSAFTMAILKFMSKSTGKTVKWDTFHDMTDSLLVGGVLVLPSESFAAGTGHSKSGNHGSRRALVKHHFHASSWTTRHPRHKHPIYGEVEKCNWNMECVKLWDANTAFYSSLPERDQQRMIGIKRLHEAQAEDIAGGVAQIPMGVKAAETPKADEPLDLAAIDAFLHGKTKVAEAGSKDAEPAKPDQKEAADAKVSVDDKKTLELDLAAIDAYLHGTKKEETHEEKPVEVADEKKDAPLDLAAIEAALHGTPAKEKIVEKKPEAIADEKKDAPLDLAAIEAALRGTTSKVESVTKEPEVVADEKKDPLLDLAAVEAALHSTGKETTTETKDQPAKSEEKEPPLDLAAIAAWIRGSQQKEDATSEPETASSVTKTDAEPPVTGPKGAAKMESKVEDIATPTPDSEVLESNDAEEEIDDFDDDWDDEESEEPLDLDEPTADDEASSEEQDSSTKPQAGSSWSRLFSPKS